MSSLKKFFGSKKNADDPKEAVKRLKETRELLSKKSEFLESKIEEELQNAKRYGMKNKKMALRALANKKKYENQLVKIDNSLNIIDSHIDSIDNAGMNLEVFRVLKTTAGTMKNVHKNMNIDKVHETMDNIMEQREILNEISDAISDPAAFGIVSEVDDDELLAELEAMEAEEMESKFLEVPDLPNVPKELPTPTTSKTKADTSEKDLNELLAWAE